MVVGMCQLYLVMIMRSQGNGCVSLDPEKNNSIICGHRPPRLMAHEEEEGVF